jgi:delta 1-pyrroline-5-carboxylate dehydrogenase
MAEKINCGVVYVNLPTVGAVVQRIGFGGWKKSRFGMGVQAGKENYVLNTTEFDDDIENLELDESVVMNDSYRDGLLNKLKIKLLNPRENEPVGMYKSLYSYLEWYEKYFSKTTSSPNNVVGEEYTKELKPLGNVTIRFDKRDSAEDVVRACGAAVIAGNTVILSVDPRIDNAQRNFYSDYLNSLGLSDKIKVIEEHDAKFISRIPHDGTNLVRYCSGKLPQSFAFARNEKPSLAVSTKNIVCHGRIELHNYMQEKSYGIAYHRSGANLRPGKDFPVDDADKLAA